MVHTVCKVEALCKVCVTPYLFVCMCSYISRCVQLQVIYMIMMSFTSEMHLPQHCQIGLIHTASSVCVNMSVDGYGGAATPVSTDISR